MSDTLKEPDAVMPMNAVNNMSNPPIPDGEAYPQSDIRIGAAELSNFATCLSAVLRQSRKLSRLKKQLKNAQEKDVDADLALDKQRRHLDMALRNEDRHQAAEISNRIADLEAIVKNCPFILENIFSSISAVEYGLRKSRRTLEEEAKRIFGPFILGDEDEEDDDLVANDAQMAKNRRYSPACFHPQVEMAQTSPLAQETERKAALRARFSAAKERVRHLQVQLEQLPTLYANSFAEWRGQHRRGQTRLSRTEFDQQQLLRARELTQQLTQAGLAYSIAGDEALEEQAIELTPSQVSKFLDQPGDGAGVTDEVARKMARTDWDRVRQWLHSVQDGLTETTSSELVLSQDCEVESVTFGEGCSTYADGNERKHIDKWNYMRERVWWATLEDGVDGPV